MPTLILPPRFTTDSITLSKAAHRRGWEVCRFTSWRIPEEFTVDKVVLYGEPLFASVVIEALGIATLEPSWDWLPNLPPDYLQRDIVMSTLGEARCLGIRSFIKPVEDKCFAAKVYENGHELPTDSQLPETTPVLVAEPVNWQIEFRTFVLNRKVMTLSPYLRRGQLAEDREGDWPASDKEINEAKIFAERFLSDSAVAVPPAFVLDVGIIEGRGWAVIEGNAAWGAGIYGCEPDEVLTVLEHAAVNKDKLSVEDKQWAIR